MSTIDDRPTIGERYSSAMGSSHLKMTERRGDLDIIIAAGLIPDGLASALFRLAHEYDGVRAEHRAAESRLRIKEFEAQGQKPTEAEATIKQAEAEALTAHALILARLRSLERTKNLFGEFAIQEATRQRFMRPDREALILAGQVLDVWLNPNCKRCDGRGTMGGSHRGEISTVCKACKGTGHRRDQIGRDEPQRKFAGHLTMRISELLAQAQRDIQSGQKLVDEAKRLIAEAQEL